MGTRGQLTTQSGATIEGRPWLVLDSVLAVPRNIYCLPFSSREDVNLLVNRKLFKIYTPLLDAVRGCKKGLHKRSEYLEIVSSHQLTVLTSS